MRIGRLVDRDAADGDGADGDGAIAGLRDARRERAKSVAVGLMMVWSG